MAQYTAPENLTESNRYIMKFAKSFGKGEALELAGQIYFIEDITCVIDLDGTRIEFKLAHIAFPDTYKAHLTMHPDAAMVEDRMHKLDI